MRKVSYFALWSSVVFAPAAAWAHIQLTSPQPRYVQDNNGLKTAPCGSGTRTGAITKLSPGQALTVTWKESVSHAGHYRIALVANDSELVEPKDLSIPSTPPSWDLADGIPDKTGTQTYSQAVRIPQTECQTCVLQLIQVMSAGTDGTNTGSFSGVYHACADVSISAGTGDAGAGPEVGAPEVGRAETGMGDVRAWPDVSSALDAVSVSSGGAGGGGAGGHSVASPASGGESGAGGATGGSDGSGGASSSGGFAGSSEGPSNGTGGSPQSGSTSSPSGGVGGSLAVGGSGRTATASGGHGGSAAGGTDGSASNRSTSGCSCHMGSLARRAPVPVWLTMVGMVTALRRRRLRPK